MTLHPDDTADDRRGPAVPPAPAQRAPYAAPDAYAPPRSPSGPDGPPPGYAGDGPPVLPPPPVGYGPPTVGGASPLAGPGPVPPGWGAPTWGGPPSWAPSGPGTALRRASGAARTVSVLCWVLLAAWVLLLAAGTAYVAADDQALTEAQYDSALSTGDGASGFGVLLLLGLGAAVWAVLAVWTCRTAEAARLAGNGSRSSRAGWAWWGLFVPLAGAVLPLLAYREAAAYLTAGHRTGGPGQGWGDGWRAEPVPRLLTAWWVLWAVAAVFVVTGAGTLDTATAGGAYVLAGLVGAASSVCGALALRRLAAVGERCAERSWG